MEKSCYKDIVDEVSKNLADRITSTEKGLVQRAATIDGDIQVKDADIRDVINFIAALVGSFLYGS